MRVDERGGGGWDGEVAGWDGDGWDSIGCPSSILHRTLALCSKDFSAWEALTEFF